LLTLEDKNILNWAILLTSGIGDDFIFLNELMAENTSLLDFSTIYNYNYDDYLFQEKENKKAFPDYKSMDYYALRHSFWFRLLINDNFYFAKKDFKKRFKTGRRVLTSQIQEITDNGLVYTMCEQHLQNKRRHR